MLRGKPTETAEGGGKKERVIIDDFREAYWWLRDNTPEDARVMAWWDYGYQINGVGNRTTIADGNTWNHEHIATLGFMLTSPEKKAHKSPFLAWGAVRVHHRCRLLNMSDACCQCWCITGTCRL